MAYIPKNILPIIDQVCGESDHSIYSDVRVIKTNPVYDGSAGEHLPLGKSATAVGGPEHELANPLYTMEDVTQVYYSSLDQSPQHNYDYVSTGQPPQMMPPTTLVPPTASTLYDYASFPGEEEYIYDTPEDATFKPRSQPQPQPELMYDYAESPIGLVGSPTAVYDAPLLATGSYPADK